MRRKSQVRFGGGRLEKEPHGHLVSRLPNDLGEEDKRENEFSVDKELRVFSAYHLKDETKIWVITESDRSATTVLLPSEY
jgi:hypothetical protein